MTDFDLDDTYGFDFDDDVDLPHSSKDQSNGVENGNSNDMSTDFEALGLDGLLGENDENNDISNGNTSGHNSNNNSSNYDANESNNDNNDNIHSSSSKYSDNGSNDNNNGSKIPQLKLRGGLTSPGQAGGYGGKSKSSYSSNTTSTIASTPRLPQVPQKALSNLKKKNKAQMHTHTYKETHTRSHAHTNANARQYSDKPYHQSSSASLSPSRHAPLSVLDVSGDLSSSLYEQEMIQQLQDDNDKLNAKMNRVMVRVDKLKSANSRLKAKLNAGGKLTSRKPLAPPSSCEVHTKQLLIDERKIRAQRKEISSLRRQLDLCDRDRLQELENLLQHRDQIIQDMRAEFNNLAGLQRQKHGRALGKGKVAFDPAKIDSLERDLRTYKHQNREYAIKVRQNARTIIQQHSTLTEYKMKVRDLKARLEEFEKPERERKRGLSSGNSMGSVGGGVE